MNKRQGYLSSHGTQEKWRMEEGGARKLNTVREGSCWTSGVDGAGAETVERWRVLLKTAAVLCCAAVLSFALQACGYSSLLSKGENI